MTLKNKKTRWGTQYLDGTQAAVKFSRLPSVSYAILCMVLAVVFAGTSLTTLLNSSGSSVAYAENEDKAKEKVQDAADKFLEDPEEGDEFPLGSAIEKMEKTSEDDREGFSYVLRRLFTVHYMNDTSKGYAAEGKAGLQCETSNPNAGTPIYHNCDIPNIMTEFIQDFIAMISQQGIIGGTTTNVALDFSAFGLPQGIPADGAPVKPSERAVKYTGLELYGYNLRYTVYNGEWDHIKVMTTARAMSNFGFMDDLKMGVTSVAQGVSGGVQGSAQGFVEGMSTGGFFGAIGGGFTGFWDGAAGGSINSILDTSDHNVFVTNSWYRAGYGSTLYNARELTETEMAAKTQNTLISMLSSSAPELATVPEDYQNIRNGPADPKEAISKCTIVDQNGSNKEIKYGNGKIAPGVTKAECQKAAQNAYEMRTRNDIDPDSKDKARYTWNAEGRQKLETLKQWKKNNESMFKTADKYGLQCDINENEAVRKDSIASFRLCWNQNYSKVSKNLQSEEQKNSTFEWVTNLFSPTNVAGWLTGNHDDNFNAPWNRYVCVDSNGRDILDSNGHPVQLYDYNGDLNEGCKPVRPPIQNGFFGNGYVSGQSQPANDTRYNDSNTNFLNIVFPLDRIVTTIGNIGLMIATFVTRVSNTVIALTYNPVMKTLGIDDIIVNLIEGFRESLFFPLIVLVVALAGVQIIWNVGRRKDYSNQATSIVMLCLTIVLGVVLMFKPAQVINAVDSVPAMVETAIMGSIFSLGDRQGDNLCYATGTINDSTFLDLSGNSAQGVGANEGARALMCENWRTFAFNPWVKGQWGTDYKNLYAENATVGPEASKMKNTNTHLVGDASVVMGGGVTERNWALYQLEVMASGTAYFKDLETPSGRLDTDMYRLVDLQAGPNNGAGTDGRYFEAWKGSGFDRAIIGPVSAIIAIVGAITVIVYSIAKIQIAFVISMMLILLPFMFLFGIHPTMGRSKLKGYFGSILGLMVQRIVLVLLIAVMFSIVARSGSLAENYWLSAILTLVIMLFFLKARKEILKFVFEGVSAGFGQPIGAQFMDNPKQWIDKNVRNKQTQGSLLGNNLQKLKVGTQSFAGGAIGGWMAGGKGNHGKGAWNSVRDNALKSSQQAVTRLSNRQRHRGYGLAQTMIEARREAENATGQRINESDDAKALRLRAHKQTDEYQAYEAEMAKYKELDSEEILDKSSGNVQAYKMDGDTQVFRPEAPRMQDMAEGAVASRRMARAIKTEDERRALRRQMDAEHLNSFNNYEEFKKTNGDNDENAVDSSSVSNLSHEEQLLAAAELDANIGKQIADTETLLNKNREDHALLDRESKKHKKDEDKLANIERRKRIVGTQIKRLEKKVAELQKEYDKGLKDIYGSERMLEEDIKKEWENTDAKLEDKQFRDLNKVSRIATRQNSRKADTQALQDMMQDLMSRAKKDE